MKLSTFLASAAVIGGSFLIPVPAEARNGWVKAGSYEHRGETVTLFVKPIDRSGSIRRFENYNTNASIKQWSAKANCIDWNIYVGESVVPVMPGSVNEAAMNIICR